MRHITVGLLGAALLVSAMPSSAAAIELGAAASPPRRPILLTVTREVDAAHLQRDIASVSEEGDLKYLTRTRAEEREASWSPDGSFILFTRFKEDQGQSVWIMGARGRDPRRISPPDVEAHSAEWSPDGESIVYVVDDRTSGYLARDLVTVSVDTGATVPVTATPDRFEESPNWSPDGSRIVFDAWPSDSRVSDIYVIDADGTDEIQLTDDKANDWRPSWSPDGAHIAFLSPRDYTCWDCEDVAGSLFVMETDGTIVGKLGNEAWNPQWFPDSGSLAWTYAPDASDSCPDPSCDADVVMGKIDGSDMHPLTTNEYPVWDNAPAISPDGTSIVFVRFYWNGKKSPKILELDVEDGSIRVVRKMNNHFSVEVEDWK